MRSVETRKTARSNISRNLIDMAAEQIFDTNDAFDFEKMTLTKPTVMAGGNHFIRFLANRQALYIQPPKCNTKQGIIRAGKRFYVDLMFTNENEPFIRWMENLETHCQNYIYKNKSEWFDGEMEMHDIENYFTSPLKIYKSGKYYIARVNITPILGKPALKIYDENEGEVAMESLTDKTNIMTILEIQGIKCSSRSFQIEMEMKQIMVLNPVNIFEKCLLVSKPNSVIKIESDAMFSANSENDDGDMENASVPYRDDADTEINIETVTPSDEKEADFSALEMQKDMDDGELIDDNNAPDDSVPHADDVQLTAPVIVGDDPDILADILTTNDGMQEIDIYLEEIPPTDAMQIKARNDVYYEMYREARRKAKNARDLALSSYLEAKRIKNTYMLDDIKDSDDSDLESDEEDNEEEISQSAMV